jgi:hypothetical protein
MDDFRGIGDLAVGLMQRISSGDFPLWSDEIDGGEGDRIGQPRAAIREEFSDLPHGEKEAETRLSAPARVPRVKITSRGGGLVVIDGGAARTHAAERTKPRPAAPLSIVTIGGERVHQWTLASG